MALIQKAFSDIITFSRSSNATRIGPTGLVEYAPHNLLSRSQELDNAIWVKNNISATANSIAAPDGTVTADTIVENTSAGYHSTYHNSGAGTVTGTYTFSAYLKAAGRSWAWVGIGTSSRAYFDLSNGVTGTISSGITASITSAGNGWYRCSVTQTVTSTSVTGEVIIVTGNNGTTYTGDGTSGIYLWGAQLSVGPYPLDYTPTTSAAVYGPRFDYDPVTLAARGLLIEEQRTNLLLQSEAFGTSPWTNGGTAPTVTADAGASPSGEATADRIQFPAAASYRYQNATLVSGTVYTISVYAKSYSGTDQVFRLTVNDFAGNSSDLTASGTWQRFTFTFTASSNSSVAFGLRTGTAGAASDILIWGAQLEAGSFATSYIPTLASSVTRSADVATVNTLSPFYNAVEGTLFGEYDTFGVSSSPYIAEFNDGTANNRITSYVSSGTQRMYVATSGAAQADLSVSSVSNNVVYKTAVVYKANDFALTQNGVSPATDTSGTIPTVSKLALGAYNSDSIANLTNGHLRRIAYYPRRLTNAEIQTLTA